MRRTIVVSCATLLWTGACFGRTVMVTGRVVDYLARPAVQAEVAVVENGQDTATELQCARICAPIGRTDAQGLFEVQAQIESMRNVFVVVRKAGLALAWDRAPLQASNADRVRFQLVMEQPASISGKVLDISGRAVAQAKLRAVPTSAYLSRLSQSPISQPEAWLSTQTDADGCFRFDGFSADMSCDFWVQAQDRPCAYVFTTNYLNGFGYPVGRSDVMLTLHNERLVRGRVVEQGTGAPVAGVELEISRPRERGQREDIKDLYLPYKVRSDADGRFSFPGVPDGDHQIDLVRPQSELAKWVAEPIGVLLGPDHAADDVTFEVDRGGLVELLVRNAQTREPVGGVVVSLGGLSLSDLPRTDSKGIARVRLRPGQARALISSGISPNDEYRSWGLRGPSEAFVVERGETTRLDVDLEPATKLRGMVVDPEGKPVPGATVSMHPLSTGSRIISNIGDELSADAQGRFEAPCGDADPRGWHVTACCEERDWVGLADVDAADEPVQIRLGPGVTVKGTVTNEEGIGIPAARVAVMVQPSGAVSSITIETLCDARGAFSLAGILPPDEATTCRLSADAAGYGPKSYVEIEVPNRPEAVTDLGAIVLIAANESLAGIAVDANDAPVPNVPVFLHGGSREITQPDRRTATDGNGRFRFERICRGPVRLQAGFSNSPLYGRASVEAGQQDVKIVLQPGTSGMLRISSAGTSIAQRPPAYVSLIGKRLDEVEGLKSLVPEDVAGRPLLILFMDQQQRPSRRMVHELAQRVGALREKEIEVVLAQTVSIDRADLDRWLAEQKLPFKAHVLPGDLDRQRYAWGVESLPWLVLTDKDHVVRAQGFRYDELNARIESLAVTQ
ncbi:MAG: carboxypeptidase regulatory-like domain-containing protein [Sedimentisphaerales bacterium]|nr:carboxypeptidase regulatory-like domain-containing protein [Sedimentisphaerales bacterium]